MKLSLALGKSKREILNTFTPEEVYEYLAYDLIEPFGLDNWHFAMLATLYANSHSDGKKKFNISDFYPKFKTNTEKTNDLLQKAIYINAIFGGTENISTRKEGQ